MQFSDADEFCNAIKYHKKSIFLHIWVIHFQNPFFSFTSSIQISGGDSYIHISTLCRLQPKLKFQNDIFDSKFRYDIFSFVSNFKMLRSPKFYGYMVILVKGICVTLQWRFLPVNH